MQLSKELDSMQTELFQKYRVKVEDCVSHLINQFNTLTRTPDELSKVTHELIDGVPRFRICFELNSSEYDEFYELYSDAVLKLKEELNAIVYCHTSTGLRLSSIESIKEDFNNNTGRYANNASRKIRMFIE